MLCYHSQKYSCPAISLKLINGLPLKMGDYVGALDQGTTSTRFIVFSKQGRIVSSAQEEHAQIFPASACVEHDPEEIWKRTCEVIVAALESAGE